MTETRHGLAHTSRGDGSSADPTGAGRVRRATGLALATLLVASSTLVSAAVVAPSAAADPVYPGVEEIKSAQTAAASKAAEIGRIEGDLAAVSARLEQVQLELAMAAEDYNEAQDVLAQRSVDALAAQERSAAAAADAADARTAIGRHAAATYRAGGGLAGLEVILSSDGPQGMLDRAATLANLGSQRQRGHQRMQASQVVADLMSEQADAALAAQDEAAAELERARVDVERKALTAQSEMGRVQQARDGLTAELAVLRETTVQLERERQEGLEAERRARAEAAARAEAERREAERRRAEAEAAAERRLEEQRQAEEDRRARVRARADRSRQAAEAAPASPPVSRERAAAPVSPERVPAPVSAERVPAPVRRVDPAPPSGSSSGSASAGQAAVDWARTQIGKPYLWGASGPDAYDCSGLTSQAWLRAGVSLPRSSRYQYAAVKKIDYSDLRVGDLVFYGTDPSNPSSIHHVAMYAGNDRVVDAPSSGKQVREVTFRRSGLMPYAGRP